MARVLFDSGASHSFVVASCVKEFVLEIETLEKSLYVHSPLGTRVRIDQICQDCELEVSEILLTVDFKVMDMSKFDVIFGTASIISAWTLGSWKSPIGQWTPGFWGVTNLISKLSLISEYCRH